MAARILVALLAVPIFAGCTHVQLRRNTIRQSATLTDIYEQQVMDNLAMFVHHPGALPFFAYPNAGGSDVSDSLAGDWNLGFDRSGFALGGFGQNASRGMTESWVLTPVFDPRRLELMRCAYQQVMMDAGLLEIGQANSQCELLQRQFYMGTLSGASVQEFTQQTGRTTPASLKPCQWFCYGPEPPDDCDACCPTGEYCGTHVWLLPGGREELSKLTLVILDYAFNVSAVSPELNQEVTLFFNSNNEPTSEDKASSVIRRIEPAPQRAIQSNHSYMKNSNGNAASSSRSIQLPPIAPADTNTFSPQGVNLQLRLLTPQ